MCETIKEDKQMHAGFELLAPAGSFEIFKAVIAAGADAVYVGGEAFGARAYADNFSGEELLEAIDYAHLFGRKIFLAVNTLLKNTELESRLYDYLLPLYERGLDAVIVQDIGVIRYLREAFPELPVHASTQMTITGVEGVQILKELGVSRAVLAREVSMEEMRLIHERTGMELEVFVHGALCYCYSGQCLFSSMLGGRSGNRGRCAQPCRLPYTVLDDKHRECLSDSYVLSLKDLCGIEDLNRLRDAGVYSLKIEGRMKQASYAAGTVSYYRKYIDQLQEQIGSAQRLYVSAKDMQELTELGSRCGFTHGYFDKTGGRDMITFVKPSYEKQNEALQRQITERFLTQSMKLPVRASLTLAAGEPARLQVNCGDVTVCAYGMEAMPAQSKPLVPDEAAARVRKTGDTPFVMEDVAVDVQGQVFLPNGALNQLRRDALAQLYEELLRGTRRVAKGERPQRESAPCAEKCARTICTVENRGLLPIILKYDFVTSVYLDAAAYGTSNLCEQLRADARRCEAAGKEAYLAMPRIFREEVSSRYHEMAQELRELPLAGVVVRSYEELYFVRNVLPEFTVVLDHSLYSYNDRAVQAFAELGADRNTVPVELNRGEIAHRDNRLSEMVIYGHYPLMVSAQCVRRNAAACTKRADKPALACADAENIYYLKDRYNVQFPVKNYCEYCYNVIYNSLPVMLFTKVDELRRSGLDSFRLDFTVETGRQVRAVLDLYGEFVCGMRQEYPKEWHKRYTNGHYNRGVE